MSPIALMFGLLLWILGSFLFLIVRIISTADSSDKVYFSDYPNLVMSFWAVLIIFLFLPLYSEFPDINTKVVTFEYGEVNVHPNGAFVWEWDNFSNLPVSSSAVDETGNRRLIEGRVSIITDNPKTRDFKYRVAYEVFSPKLFYGYYDTKYKGRRELKGSVEVFNEIQRTIQYQFYEFNDDNSRELTRFYNPLDHQQQLEFFAFFSNWLNERLDGDGIRITHAEFNF